YRRAAGSAGPRRDRLGSESPSAVRIVLRPPLGTAVPNGPLSVSSLGLGWSERDEGRAARRLALDVPQAGRPRRADDRHLGVDHCPRPPPPALAQGPATPARHPLA